MDLDLELATLADIDEELGKRSAYGDFMFVHDDAILIGNRHDLLKTLRKLFTIAYKEGLITEDSGLFDDD